MKVCPKCDFGYPDSQTACPTHACMLSEIRELRPGIVIHHSYKIVRKLGQGGMGAVYLAQHMRMDEPRALKFLSSELSHDEAFKNRFLREVKSLRQVRNKNVVDCGDLEAAEDDSLFFPMEFVDGPDLRDFLHNAPKPFDVKLALEIVRGIAVGLGAAHACGMVHRDIKPENILMAREGGAFVPKIADFGIVASKKSSTVYTRTTGTSLTMPYAAPEQWRGMRSSELDGRTDFYALGGVLFEMLIGHTVFDADSYEGWAEHHKNVDPSSPSSLRPDLATWQGLDSLVLCLLAKDREQRPGNVTDLLDLIDAVLSNRQEPRWRTPSDFGAQLVDEMRGSRSLRSPSSAGQALTLLGHKGMVNAVAFSPDGRTLASGSVDGTIRVWDVASGTLLRTLDADIVFKSLAFSPDGSILASGGYNVTIQLWDVASGQVVRTMRGHTDYVYSVAFSPDGRTLASGSKDKSIKLWDTASGVRTLQGNAQEVYTVAFSPDGRTLASGSISGNTVKLWDVASGELLRALRGKSGQGWVNSVAFSSDGRILASGLNGDGLSQVQDYIEVWDVAGGEVLCTLQGHSDNVFSVAFSPIGHTLASGSQDKTIKLWDVASGNVLRTLSGHASHVSSVAFSSDGRSLASGSWDRTVKLWDVTNSGN